MDERGSCVWIVRENAYVWARGQVVHIYGYVQWARRLTGEVIDAHPHSSVHVPGFANDDEFREWCRTYDQRLRDAATRRAQALLRKSRDIQAPPEDTPT